MAKVTWRWQKDALVLLSDNGSIRCVESMMNNAQETRATSQTQVPRPSASAVGSDPWLIGNGLAILAIGTTASQVVLARR